MSRDGRDGRAAPRARVQLRVSQRCGASAEVLVGEAEDLSAIGVFVRCDEPHAVGTPVALELALAEGAPPLAVAGQVVRVGVGAGGGTGMGIFFAELEPQVREALRAFVAERIRAAGG